MVLTLLRWSDVEQGGKGAPASISFDGHVTIAAARGNFILLSHTIL